MTLEPLTEQTPEQREQELREYHAAEEFRAAEAERLRREAERDSDDYRLRYRQVVALERIATAVEMLADVATGNVHDMEPVVRETVTVEPEPF